MTLPTMTFGGAAPPIERRIEVGGGVGLHCLEWRADPAGTGARTPFLLVHGLASNCRTWEAVGGLLAAAGHPVVALDQRGHGRSDKPDWGYEFATLCDDLEEVLDALHYGQAVVVGQSTGGNIAVELARRAGGRLAGVAGIDGGIIELQQHWPQWEDCAEVLAPPQLAGTPVDEVAAHLRRTHPDWDDWGIDATLANLEVAADGTVRARLHRDQHMLVLRALWEHRPSVVLPELEVPVLLVVADGGDEWSDGKRADADRAAKLLRHGRIHWVSPADHDLHVQQPARLSQFLMDAGEDFWR